MKLKTITTEDVYAKFKQTIEEYELVHKDKKLLVCFSGGRNSSAMLHLLNRYSKESSFDFITMLMPYPLHVYSNLNEVLSYWKSQGIEPKLFKPAMNDEALVKSERPCSACKYLRRRVFTEEIASKFDLKKICIATGYSVWDICAYLIELILQNKIAPNDSQENQRRLLELSNRLKPKFVSKNGVTIIRPCIKLNDPELESYLKHYAIPINEVDCHYLPMAPKRVLFNCFRLKRTLEDNLIEYDRVMDVFNKSLKFPAQEEYDSLGFEEYLF